MYVLAYGYKKNPEPYGILQTNQFIIAYGPWTKVSL